MFGCNNSQKTPNISLYLIPNDSRRSEFIRRLGRADKRDDPRWRICSSHFTEAAFERNALHEYVYVKGGKCKKLGDGAFPTENLPATVKLPSSPETPRSERHAKRQRTLIAHANTEQADIAIALHESLTASPPKWAKMEEANEALTARVRVLEGQLAKANNENMKLRKAVLRAKRSHTISNTQLRRSVLTQQRKSRVASKLRSTLTKFSTTLAKSFSKGQMQVLRDGKRYAKWSDCEMARAIVFRKISRRGYRYARERMNLPLPHERSLQRWSRCIPAQPGFVPAACVLFEYISKCGSAMQRIALLCLDEMKVSSVPSYSTKNDCVYIASQAQTFMVRALFAKWKIIVHYNYDTKATKELILQIVLVKSADN